jgi:hypothetical protein
MKCQVKEPAGAMDMAGKDGTDAAGNMDPGNEIIILINAINKRRSYHDRT